MGAERTTSCRWAPQIRTMIRRGSRSGHIFSLGLGTDNLFAPNV
jgi:hypothetical protein